MADFNSDETYREGRRAYYKGLPIETCPHPPESDQAGMWVSGFKDAQDDIEDLSDPAHLEGDAHRSGQAGVYSPNSDRSAG